MAVPAAPKARSCRSKPAFGWTQRLVRTDRYKLVHYPKIGRNQLFDLKEDPNETKDLINDPKLEPVKKKLLATLSKKRIELGDGLLSAKSGK